MLLNRLRTSYDTGFNLEKTANEWYDETTKSISKMNIDDKKYLELSKLKSEIIDEKQRKQILNARNSMKN